ncbi:MAG: 7-carboxy-7-deazaguanine synthase QueE [Candidatus Hydrothermia bacterium]
MRLIVSEIFSSIQGEGPKIGAPSVFLRLGGCNLHCKFCDTDYASYLEYASEWRSYPLEGLIGKIYEIKGDLWNLVITGGEPLIQEKALRVFIGRVQSAFTSIEIETNGTILPQELKNLNGLLFNVSIKLSNAGIEEEERIKPEVIDFYANWPLSIFKFVVESRQDLDEIEEITREFYIPKQRVYLMPRSRTTRELNLKALEVVQFCLEMGFNYSDRLQLRIFKGIKGK